MVQSHGRIPNRLLRDEVPEISSSAKAAPVHNRVFRFSASSLDIVLTQIPLFDSNYAFLIKHKPRPLHYTYYGVWDPKRKAYEEVLRETKRMMSASIFSRSCET